MKLEDLKKLAKYTILNKAVSARLANFVINKLSRKEMIIYLRYLKMLVDRESVRIISEIPISNALRKKIKKKFPKKIIEFEQNENAGPGMKVIINNSVIDLSFAGYLEQTVKNLKQEI